MTDPIVKNPPFSSSYFGNTIFCEVISALTKCSGSSVAALNGDKKTNNSPKSTITINAILYKSLSLSA